MATYTNFACISGGSNLNAGTRTGDTTVPGTGANHTYASGNWVAGTGVFTVASGDPAADGVTVGDFASVYADGATTTGFVGRVTARDATTITVSLTAKSGTAPTNGTGDRTLKIGGAWAGPSGASGFPFNFCQASCTNAAADTVRVNIAAQTYSITAVMTAPSGAATTWWGFTSAYGDGGRAIIDGGTSGASYILWSGTSGNISGAFIQDLEFRNNGATGSAAGVSIVGATNVTIRRCSFNSVRGAGLTMNTVGVSVSSIDESEFFACNQSNTSSTGALLLSTATARVSNSMFHDNAGANTSGVFVGGGQAFLSDCVFDTNGGIGLAGSTVVGSGAVNCDFYNNGSHGASIGTIVGFFKNCNFLKNGGWGIAHTGLVTVINCGFGTGTEVNVSGDIQTTAKANEFGTVNYASNLTPWSDPADGNFTITLAAAKGTGRGAFLQTQTGYGDPSPTVAYPDIGAGQTNGGAIAASTIAAQIVKVASIGTY
jgi:hypothetical protein